MRTRQVVAHSSAFSSSPALRRLLASRSGFAVARACLQRSGDLGALQLWAELRRLTADRTLGKGDRARLQASVVARARSALIRHHRELSVAVQPSRRGQHLASAIGEPWSQALGAPDNEEESECEEGGDDVRTARCVKAAALQLLHEPTSRGRFAVSHTREYMHETAHGEVDVVLDAIQLQLQEDASDPRFPSSFDAPSMSLPVYSPSASSHTPSALVEGEEFALHQYAARLTTLLLQRLPQLQDRLESSLAAKHWPSIAASREYREWLRTSAPASPGIDSIDLSYLSTEHPQTIGHADDAPLIDPARVKLIVTYFEKQPMGVASVAASVALRSPVNRDVVHEQLDSVALSQTPSGYENEPSSKLPGSIPGSLEQPQGVWRKRTLHLTSFPSGSLLIGRAPHVDCSVPDSGVSRTHGKIVWNPPPLADDDGSEASASAPAPNLAASSVSPAPPAPFRSPLLYVDLDSTYGSRVDGTRVSRAALSVGSVVHIGKHVTVRIVHTDANAIGSAKGSSSSASAPVVEHRTFKCIIA